MCKRGDMIEMRLPVVGGIRQGIAKIDRCIAPIIKALNDGGVTTIGCCCGHREQTGYIHLTGGRYLGVYTNAKAFRREARRKSDVKACEDKTITVAMAKTSGNKAAAARLLNMPIRTLQRKIKKRIAAAAAIERKDK